MGNKVLRGQLRALKSREAAASTSGEGEKGFLKEETKVGLANEERTRIINLQVSPKTMI